MTIAMRKGYAEWLSSHPEPQTAWGGFIGAWVMQQNIINHLLAENTRLTMELRNVKLAYSFTLPDLPQQPNPDLPGLQQPGSRPVQMPDLRVPLPES